MFGCWDWLGIRMHMETEHRCLRVCATKTKFLQFLFAFNWNFVKFYFSLWYLQLCELLRLARSYRRNDKRSMYICCWLWLPCSYSCTKGFERTTVMQLPLLNALPQRFDHSHRRNYICPSLSECPSSELRIANTWHVAAVEVELQNGSHKTNLELSTKAIIWKWPTICHKHLPIIFSRLSTAPCVALSCPMARSGTRWQVLEIAEHSTFCLAWHWLLRTFGHVCIWL